jgi:hypothetical protein
MLKSKILKKMTMYSLVAVIGGVGQVALAHTIIRDAGTEGVALYTGIVVTHGVAGPVTNLPQLPVIAQSAVFPNSPDSIGSQLVPATGVTTDPGYVAASEISTNLADHLDAANYTALTGLALGLNGIQDKSVFTKQDEIVQGSGTTAKVRGFKFTNGNLLPNLYGVQPFQIAGVKFKPTSCAKSLRVRVAVANWGKKSSAVDNGTDNKADIWIGTPTTLFNDLAGEVVSDGYWPTYTINRNLTTNPLPASCPTYPIGPIAAPTSTQVGFDIAIQPSSTDIDTYLPITGYWPL